MSSDLPAQLNIPAPPVMAKAMEDGMYAKATAPAWKIFWLGITGGAFIAFGFILFTTSQMGFAGSDWPIGFSRLLGGVAFAAGLVMVINSGSDLFTGSTLTVMPLASKRINGKQFGVHWGLSYVANFLGSVLVAILVFMAGTYNLGGGAWGTVVLNTSLTKVSYGWFQVLVLGILANWLVCMAVWMTFAGRSFIDKVLAIVIPLVVFVGTGFEHSVANMFMLPAGWIIKTFAPAAFWDSPAVQAAGIDLATFDSLTITSILWNNIIPVSIGNIIGGVFGVGLYFWVAYRKDAVKAEREAAVKA